MTLIANSASKSSVTDVAPIGNNHFVVVWQQSSPTVIRGRVITAAGEIASDGFDISTHGGASLPSVTGCGDQNNPGFAVAWNDTNTNKVKVRIFHGIDGGNEITVSSGEVRTEDRPVIARLTDQQIVVAWASAGLGGEGVRTAFLNPQGNKLGEVRVDRGSLVNIGPLAGAALENGTFAVVWHGADNLASARPRIQILKPDRTKLGAERSPDMGQGELSMSVLFPTIVGEEKGNFVVARSGGKVALANLFSEDGTPVIGETTINTPPLELKVAREPDVAAIQVNGQAKYIVVWTEHRTDGDGTGENVIGRTFAELLDAGPVFTIGADGFGNQTKPSIATGDFLDAVAIAYLDDAQPGLAADTRAVQATTLIFN